MYPRESQYRKRRVNPCGDYSNLYGQGSSLGIEVLGGLEETCLSEETVLSKFMQSLGDAAYTRLRKIADDRDITVQELIRAIVIPDWLKLAELHDGGSSQSERHRKRVSRAGARTSELHIAVASKSKKKQ